jgi:1,4-dihydroxy-2-naphthoate polyprenyltransferase
MTKIKYWIQAARLRTLPLALSSILAGGLLAAREPTFHLLGFFLILLTATLLQILSNFANDYGDTINGADHQQRQGPMRTVQAGLLSAGEMKNAIWVSGLLAFVAGMSLLFLTAWQWGWEVLVIFLVIGLLAIFAAITYTAGSLPYGYRGLGDISVLLFFGIVGVSGTHYLLVGSFNTLILLPALSCGLFAVGVLNLNNLRDIESDKQAGKYSIPVRIGYENAKLYHYTLLIAGMFSSVVFAILSAQATINWLFVASFPFFIWNIIDVQKAQEPQRLDPLLKKLALSTLFFALLLGIGYLL